MTAFRRLPLDGLNTAEVAAIRALPASRLPRTAEDAWTTSDVAFAWTQSQKLPFLPLNEQRVDRDAYALYWRHCREYGWLPTFASDDVSTVISAHPHRPQMRREVGKLLRCEAYWSGCTQNDFDRTLAALGAPSSQESLPPPVVIPAAWVLEMQPEAPDPYRGGVIEVLQTAYRLGASDVFFEDEGPRIGVRCRLSGVAEVFPPIRSRNKSTFMGALKRMAAVSPNERFMFHDARFSVDFPDGTRIDIRAAFAPTLVGETVGLRLQDSKKMVASNMKVPLPPDLLEQFQESLNKKGGMTLVTGPTGSGKTTTLYAALLSLDRADLVIRTAEDPVEYTLPGISQVPVGGDTGRTFGQALRSFLRLNPDVILVGEIRDEETALLALEAGLTGHTVLSTLHAADCTETVTRYMQMVKSTDIRGALASAMGLILSQRLAPRLCAACREESAPSEQERILFGKFGATCPPVLYRRRGCPECGTGIRGRIPVLEQMVLSSRLKDIIRAPGHFDSQTFRRQWLTEGGKPMGRAALELAAAGAIEIKEAKRHMVWVPEAP